MRNNGLILGFFYSPKHGFYAKTMRKAVIFCVFLHKYSLKNAFSVGGGEQFGERNRTNISYN